MQQGSTQLKVVRCQDCGTILFKADLGPGTTIEAKCAKCNTFTLLHTWPRSRANCTVSASIEHNITICTSA